MKHSFTVMFDLSRTSQAWYSIYVTFTMNPSGLRRKSSNLMTVGSAIHALRSMVSSKIMTTANTALMFAPISSVTLSKKIKPNPFSPTIRCC